MSNQRLNRVDKDPGIKWVLLHVGLDEVEMTMNRQDEYIINPIEKTWDAISQHFVGL